MNRAAELYTDVASSLQKWCLDKIATMQTSHPGLQDIDWDAHSELHELPSCDLLGTAGLGMVREQAFFEIAFSIGMSTFGDTNLFRIREMASTVFGDLQPLAKVPIYRSANYVSGDPPLGWMIVQSPVMITPISRAETRVLQFLNARATLDPLLQHVG